MSDLRKFLNILIVLPLLAVAPVYAQDSDAAAAVPPPGNPCEDDEAFDAFDFWLGEWVVHGPGGQFAGTNVISKELRGCQLVENWSSATGMTGSSINYLDRITNEWVQIWNDEYGGQINIRGGMTEDGMALSGTIHYIGNNTTFEFRALWTPLDDGRVRQFFEQKNADGEWFTWFDGYYTRKSEIVED